MLNPEAIVQYPSKHRLQTLKWNQSTSSILSLHAEIRNFKDKLKKFPIYIYKA